MELVFIRIKESIYSDQAEPYVELFAKKNNLKLTKFVDIKDIPQKYDVMKVYPVLFFVDNSKIVGHVKGFSTDNLQLEIYEVEYNFVKNPELRPSTETEG
jgi:hypothetical protein